MTLSPKHKPLHCLAVLLCLDVSTYVPRKLKAQTTCAFRDTSALQQDGVSCQ